MIYTNSLSHRLGKPRRLGVQWKDWSSYSAGRRFRRALKGVDGPYQGFRRLWHGPRRLHPGEEAVSAKSTGPIGRAHVRVRARCSTSDALRWTSACNRPVPSNMNAIALELP